MQKSGLDFNDIDPIFKVTEGQRRLKNALYILYLLKGSMDFNQTYTDISFGGAKKNLWDFGDLDPIFKVTGGQRLLKNVLSPLYLLNRSTDFNHTCIGTWKRFGQILVTLTLFSRSQEIKNCWKMPFFIISPEGINWLKSNIDMCLVWR